MVKKHVKMHTFYKTDGRKARKMHAFYKTDNQKVRKNVYVLKDGWLKSMQKCMLNAPSYADIT